MTNVRTTQQLADMRKSGEICARALAQALRHVGVGVTTWELDEIARKEIVKQGGQSSFMTVDDYQFTTCMTVNDDVVHGIPTDYKLQANDILGIDIGAIYNGWHSDLAESVIVDPKQADKGRVTFLEVGKKALFAAIAQAKAGNKIGDVSHAMQMIVEDGGYNVVRALTGHGVGMQLHEEPIIPCFGKPHKGETFEPGMTVAIEVIYNQGKADVRWKNEDGWTISTVDASLSGLFERTVAIADGEPEILTPIDKFLNA